MDSIYIDVEKFLTLINAKERGWDEEILKNIACSTMFFKYIEDSTSDTHYIKSLVQDALSVIDSLCQKSQRYYYFILRSYIENFLRVLLKLKDDDAMGVMKLFKNTKRLLEQFEGASLIFDQMEQQYDECSLFVHSNIKADDEISEFLKNILTRNDFDEPFKVNNSLLKFNSLLNSSVKLFLISHTQTVDSCFYRKKEILKKILSEENYQIFSDSLV
ncbi:hypothetical protein [Metabacillus elymi]|uniref:Uncharacterized protein n=1 Tax=Metabacillus elymi TaxID=2745198 RepID=A0ABX6S363_9BACI|nr:hypothetical protein [Metabacillus sp. KUDC1714]QNF28530.1 hypothetical protein HUW50_14205 [Metabacillus sp. KUDC1714]